MGRRVPVASDGAVAPDSQSAPPPPPPAAPLPTSEPPPAAPVRSADPSGPASHEARGGGEVRVRGGGRGRGRGRGRGTLDSQLLDAPAPVVATSLAALNEQSEPNPPAQVDRVNRARERRRPSEPPAAAADATAPTASGRGGGRRDGVRALPVVNASTPRAKPETDESAPPQGRGRGGRGRGRDGSAPGGGRGRGGRGGDVVGVGVGVGVGKWWWRRLTTEVDPISLEPIAQLPHAPFALLADGSVSTWFDPVVLSSYLVSTANFAHPLSRRPLDRLDCQRLDEHCAAGRLKPMRVLEAFEHKEEYAAAAAVAAAAADAGIGREELAAGLIAARQAEASDVLRALFAQRDADAAGRAGARGAPAPPAHGSANQNGRFHGEATNQLARFGADNLALPAGRQPDGRRAGGARTHAAAAATAARLAADASASSEGNFRLIDDDASRHAGAAAHAREELFPALPAPAAPPPRVEVPRLAARPARAPAPPPPPADADADAAATAAAERRQLLALAFSIDRPDARPSMFASSAAAEFSADVLALARAQPALVARVEATVDAFLASGARRFSCEPMGRRERALVHEAARKYGVVTGSYGDDPQRRVDLFKTDRQGWPPYRLSDAARLGEAEAAAGASGGAAAAALAASSAANLELHLVDVESAEAVYSLLRQSGDDVTLEWTAYDGPGRKTPTAGVARFQFKGTYEAARARAGGGLRGAYRVLAAAPPPPPPLPPPQLPPRERVPPPPGLAAALPPRRPPPPAPSTSSWLAELAQREAAEVRAALAAVEADSAVVECPICGARMQLHAMNWHIESAHREVPEVWDVQAEGSVGEQ